MKEQYLQPEVEALNLAVEQAILDASGGESDGENINGKKNTYDWGWIS